jgi:hypothetical protein
MRPCTFDPFRLKIGSPSLMSCRDRRKGKICARVWFHWLINSFTFTPRYAALRRALSITGQKLQMTTGHSRYRIILQQHRYNYSRNRIRAYRPGSEKICSYPVCALIPIFLSSAFSAFFTIGFVKTFPLANYKAVLT